MSDCHKSATRSSRVRYYPHTHTHTERERERERDNVCLSVSRSYKMMHAQMHTHTHTHTHAHCHVKMYKNHVVTAHPMLYMYSTTCWFDMIPVRRLAFPEFPLLCGIKAWSRECTLGLREAE